MQEAREQTIEVKGQSGNGKEWSKKIQTQEEVDRFVELIDYNRSQRNQDKDFLMEQFMDGNISLKEGTQFQISNVGEEPGFTAMKLLFKILPTYKNDI